MKIKKYADDNNVSINDKVIGSDSEQGGETKNYSFKKIIDLFKSQGIATIEDLDKKTDKGDYLGTTKELNDRVVTLEENSGGEGSQTTIDTAFYDKQFSTTMSLIHDVTKPNLNINITANLSLVITGTANGDSGIVNLYFSGTEVATLSGITNLIVTGAGEMIPVYFMHDTDGLKWYSDSVSNDGGSVDTSIFAKADGTTLWHSYSHMGVNVGTVSSSGTSWTGTNTDINNNWVNAKITVAGQTTLIVTVDEGNQTFTTEDTIVATNESLEVRFQALKILNNGRVEFYGANDGISAYVLLGDKTQFIKSVLVEAGGEVTFTHPTIIMGNLPTYANEVAAQADGGLRVGAVYLITGSSLHHSKL